MLIKEFESKFENFELDTQYAEFLMANCEDKLCCNGDQLLRLQEELYMYKEFRDSIINIKG